MRFDDPADGARPDEAGQPNGSVSRLWQAVRADLSAALSERLHLLTLELRQARDRLPRLLVWGALAMLMGLVGWLAAWAAVTVVVATSLGLVMALVLVAAANLVVAGLLAWRAMRLLRQLGLPETMAHLRLRPERPARPNAADEPRPVMPPSPRQLSEAS